MVAASLVGHTGKAVGLEVLLLCHTFACFYYAAESMLPMCTNHLHIVTKQVQRLQRCMAL